MTNQHSKVFRAERTTQNRDDFKVLIIGLMIGIVMLLVFPMVGPVGDKYFKERPFIRATVEVIQTYNYERPMLLYDADAVLLVEATWIAIIRDADDNRLATRRGTGNYSTDEDNPRLWTWAAFFDQSDGTEPPPTPVQPFKVCVRYISVTIDTRVSDETPETCSLIFNPEEGTTEITGE